MPGPLPSPPPQSIEGFRIGARLCESGALVVHAGTSRLDLPVEVFLVREDALTGGFEADDFLAGVRRAAAVYSESLLPFVTGGRHEDLLYAIAKSAEGSTLEAFIVAGGALPEATVLTMAAAIAGALVALERGGMRHGHLTPQRILRAGKETWVVGPPRLVPASVSPRAERWQAPEEARGSENGVQSDLFSLGMIVVYAVNGAYPLGDGVEPRRVLRDWKAPDLTSMLRRASPEARSVVAKLLAPEPANRFASAADALRAIEEASHARPETAPISLASVPTLRPMMADAARRSPGRLYVESRLGEAMLELDDDATHVGSNELKNVRAQEEPFDGATIRLVRGPQADSVSAVLGELRVNGRATASQALADGDRIEAPGIVARYERTTRAALRATGAASAEPPPGNPLAAAITVVAVLGTAVALGWGALSVMGSTKESSDAKTMAARAQQLLAEDKRLLGPAETTTPAQPAGPSQAEIAARDAYDSAAQWGRRHPAEARTKFYAVWQRYPDTAYGLLARLDALELDRGRKPVRDRSLEDLLASANTPDGLVDDETLSKLRTWAEEHPNTLAGERAHLALVKAMALQRGRFDADIAAVRAAVAKKDWREALSLISKLMDYVPPNLKDEVLAERRRVEEGMGEILRESPGGGRPPGGGAGPKPKDPGAGAGPEGEQDRNRKAEETFRGARKLMDGGKEAEALDAFLLFLREYKDTPNGAKYDPEARGRISELSTGPAGVLKLFRGKAEQAEKGRFRISYDFSDPAQLQDFRDVLAFESPPRAAWKIADGAVRSTRGSGALVLDAVFAANEFSTDVTVIPDHPHDIGVMYMDPSEQRRFYLFTLQNTFFTLGRGEAAKPFLENAVVLFGPNMWRDTPPGQLGFVRKCGSPEPSVRPSESTPVRTGKSEGEVWMKFEGGRSMRGSAYGDTKYEFPGVTPGLFVLSSAGQFDDFVVVGIPDRDWVQKRWRAILSGL